nr:retrovirus-related Pol polyprotein from transposon TNT 1-94 [Tanacetum cinerariifolium]
MKVGEKIDTYLARTLTIVNKMKANGDPLTSSSVVAKILRSLTPKFNYVEEDQVLKVTTSSSYHGRGRDNNYRNHVRLGNDVRMAVMGKGHVRLEVEGFTHSLTDVYYVPDLMNNLISVGQVQEKGVTVLIKEGDKRWFYSLDNTYRNHVRLGNDVRMAVIGKGHVRLEVEGFTHSLTDAYYVPDLMNNLISVGQVQEKGVTILIKEGSCSLYHPKKGLTIRSQMTTNRMFLFKANPVSNMENGNNGVCPKAEVEIDNSTQLWHQRFGHIHTKSLQLLHEKNLVKRLPLIKDEAKPCADCLVGKQTRESFPKTSSWRA